MKLTIHGPNLIDQSKGTFHVHTANCRDNAREVKNNGSEQPWTVDVDSRENLVRAIYSDHIAEAESEREWLRAHPEDEIAKSYPAGSLDGPVDWHAYDDLHVAPCVTNLPAEPDPKPSGAIADDDVEIGSVYAAKLKNRIAHVRVDSVNDDGGWNATTLDTNRSIVIKSAAQLRREITPESSEQLAAHVNGESKHPSKSTTDAADATIAAELQNVDLDAAVAAATKPAATRGPLQLPSGVTASKIVLDFVKARASSDVDAGGQGRPFITHTGKLVIHAKWLRDYLAETIDPNVTVSQAVTMLRDLGYADRSVAVVGAATKNLSVWMIDAPRGTGSIERLPAPERKTREATS